MGGMLRHGIITKKRKGGGMYQHIASWFQGIEQAGGLRHVVVNTSAGGGLREGG